MTVATLAAAAPVTPAWLTLALRNAGSLPHGTVTAVTPNANAAFNSAALHLELTYSPDAPADSPRRLFLKRNLAAAWAVRAGAHEVAFYQMVAPQREQVQPVTQVRDDLAGEQQAKGRVAQRPALIPPQRRNTHHSVA
jgi:hypothetical protein